METKSFDIAPMDSLFRRLSWFLLLIPIGFAAGAMFESPARWLFAGVGAFVAAIYAFVWLWMRPSRFEISGAEMSLVFPARRIKVDRADVSSADVVSYDEFKARYPRPLRVGAGGLFGGFGLLYTKKGRVQFYITRFEPLVLIEFGGREPLLLSPENPENLAELMSDSDSRRLQ